MKDILYCYQCGTKLSLDAKFCHACGTLVNKVETGTVEVENKNQASDKLYEQYKQIICDKIILAYCNKISPAINILYQNGVSYGFTKEMVDKVAHEQKKLIDRFVKHLEDLYIDGSLLMLDCTWQNENECIKFGENLGFYEEDAKAIYLSFIEANKIKEKNILIFKQIDEYERKGTLDHFKMISKDANIDDDTFYIPFVKAAEELEKFQDSLHKKSNSIKLSKADMDALYQKAEDLGFYDIPANPIYEDSEGYEVISKLIGGNEIKLGYMVQLNEKMLSRVIPFQKICILGEEICYESSYFLEKYVMKTFSAAGSRMENLMIETLKKQVDDIENPKLVELIEKIGSGFHIMWKEGISAVCDELPIDEENKKELRSKATSFFKTFFLNKAEERFSQFAEAFRSVDMTVDAVALQKELKSLSTGTWSGGGFGLKDTIVGAATATALNAGNKAIHNLINSISMVKVKNQAHDCKLKILKMVLSELEDAFAYISIIASGAIYGTLSSMYVLSFSPNDADDVEKIYTDYFKERNVEKKRKLVHRLLKVNPEDNRLYEVLLDRIFAETEQVNKDDIKNVYDLAAIFNVDLNPILNDFEKKEKEKLQKNYSKGDIRRCKMLLKLENVLGRKIDVHNRVLREFIINNVSFQQKEYTEPELSEIVGSLCDFGSRFEYPTKDLIVTKTEKYLQYHIEKDFNMPIDSVKNLLDDVNLLNDKYPEIRQQLKEVCNKEMEKYIKNNDMTNLREYTFVEICSVIDTLNNIESKFGYKVDNFIEDRTNRYLEHCIKNDLKEYTPSEINSLLKNINLLHEKYPENKTAFDTARKQATSVILKHYAVVLNTSDPQKIEHNIKCLKYLDENCALDFSCALKNERLKLEQIKIEEDVQKRTAFGVEYATEEEAHTVEAEIEKLQKILEDINISQTMRYLKIIQCEFTTKKAKEEMKKQEKKLINHIEFLRSETKRESSFGKLLITLIVTPIVGCIGLAFSIIGIIIAICVIGAFWSWYVDVYKECKEHNSLIPKHKQEINEFENLFIIKDGHLIKR